MFKVKNLLFLIVLLLTTLSCLNNNEKSHSYENQIGDTPFNLEFDNSSFKFCDSLNVLHKRALISYKGGEKALEEELIRNYNSQNYKASFSGFFIVRFAVNCNNESGRFRMQILDANFKPTKCSNALQKNILNAVKKLKDWQHAFYKGKDYDCYRFLTIKMESGKIIKA